MIRTYGRTLHCASYGGKHSSESFSSSRMLSGPVPDLILHSSHNLQVPTRTRINRVFWELSSAESIGPLAAGISTLSHKYPHVY